MHSFDQVQNTHQKEDFGIGNTIEKQNDFRAFMALDALTFRKKIRSLLSAGTQIYISHAQILGGGGGGGVGGNGVGSPSPSVGNGRQLLTMKKRLNDARSAMQSNNLDRIFKCIALFI